MSALPDGWRALERDEIEKDWEAEAPIVAMWEGPNLRDVTLYADGMVEAEGGTFPVELVPFVQLSWIGSLRGKVAG